MSRLNIIVKVRKSFEKAYEHVLIPPIHANDIGNNLKDTRRNIVFHFPLKEYLLKLVISVKDVATKWCEASFDGYTNFGKMTARGRWNHSCE